MQLPHILSRPEFLATAIMGIGSCFQFVDQFLFNNGDSNDLPPTTVEYHEPPPGTPDYSNNPTVFGEILRGKVPSRPYRETAQLYAFRDRSPKAPLHALVIPKSYVPTVYSLKPSKNKDDDNDVQLVQDMRKLGLDILKNEYPTALENNDYILCFHIPPFNSVDHLHLHVLAPASG